MKIRPLPETDLARTAPLPPDQMRNALEALRLGRPPYSYAPVRRSLSDILNVGTSIFGALSPPPWEKIKNTIRRGCTNALGEAANLAVAEALLKYAQDNALTGRRVEIFPLQLGGGTKVTYWHPVVLKLDGRPIIPFFDPRRSKALQGIGRRFVFSMMHERIRAADPDFAEVRLGIFQFSTPEQGPRKPILFTGEGETLYSFEELERMFAATYAMWREIHEERAAEMKRRKGGPGDDDLFSASA